MLRRIAGDITYYYRRGGIAGIQQWASQLYYRKAKSLHGENIFDYDWDLCIILDATRPDLFEEVVSEYAFIEGFTTKRSVGSSSKEWMAETFTSGYATDLQQTALVTGNPFSDEMLTDDQFALLDEVWRYAWDEHAGTVPPKPITDRGITVHRTQSPRRLVLYYLQPHIPFIANEEYQNVAPQTWGEDEGDPFLALQRGTRDFEDVWEAYKNNLRLVLDDVGRLRRNVDAGRVILTADHGNALGEAGLYGHADGIAHASMREVPWATATAENSENDTIPKYDRRDTGGLEDRLRALGYR